MRTLRRSKKQPWRKLVEEESAEEEEAVAEIEAEAACRRAKSPSLQTEAEAEPRAPGAEPAAAVATGEQDVKPAERAAKPRDLRSPLDIQKDRRGKVGLTIKGKMDLAPKKPAPGKAAKGAQPAATRGTGIRRPQEEEEGQEEGPGRRARNQGTGDRGPRQEEEKEEEAPAQGGQSVRSPGGHPPHLRRDGRYARQRTHRLQEAEAEGTRRRRGTHAGRSAARAGDPPCHGVRFGERPREPDEGERRGRHQEVHGTRHHGVHQPAAGQGHDPAGGG